MSSFAQATQPSLGSSRLASAALFAVGLAPLLAMLLLVIRNWLPLPTWDEWETPGEMFVSFCQGTLGLRDLIAQHNESRKFFPRLLYLALAQFGGWDVRKEMAFIFLSVCVTAALFGRLIGGMPGASARTALLAWAVASFLCFSPVQFENFLWGVQVEVFFPGLAVLVIAWVNLSRLSVSRKAVVNGTLTLIATYTVAHGMLLWLLGIPLLARGGSLRKNWTTYAAYMSCAAIASGAYFIGYTKPGYHPAFFGSGLNVLQLGHYLILWVGSYFNSAFIDPFAVGLVAVLIFLASLVSAVLVIRRTGDWRSFYAPILIAVYACATAAITAVGRIGFGVEQALNTRYRVFSLAFYLALVALLFALYCTAVRRASWPQRQLFHLAAGITALAALLAWSACYLEGLPHLALAHERDLSRLRALEWIEVIPDNPDLDLIFPEREVLRERARVVRDHHLLRLPFVSARIAQQLQHAAPPATGADHGQMTTCRFDPEDHNLVITGRAQLPDGKRAPDCVLIGALEASGSYKPINVLEAVPRPNKKKGYAKFARAFKPTNVPPGEITIAAWAVDLGSEKLYPLAGTTRISPGKR